MTPSGNRSTRDGDFWLKSMDLSIILVNYNTKDFLRRCLGSVYGETRDIQFEVIVVDNASSDGSVEMLAREFPDVRRLENATNRGFAAANNQGIVSSKGDLVLLLNTDTVILGGAIQKTVRFMQAHPEAGIAGCKLVYPDYRHQRSVGTFPSLLDGFLGSSFLYLLLPPDTLVRQRSIIHFDYDSDGEADWVTGAFLLVRRGVLDRIGLLDEQFYVYSEEVDFCRRAKEAGFRVWYTASATVIHAWNGMSAASRRSLLWTLVSQMLYFKKHHRGAEQLCLILLKYLGLAARVVVYFFAGILTFNKRMIAKSVDSAYVMYRLLTTRSEYRHNSAGEVIPWTSIW